ncbi:LacI family DNA-binding transcriptional regulator [Spirochaeta isovalerica]|uniref:LacI family transcriptional regulator n=1 Tax=Spirochaeta isovalerica TaxID=150 RepID=A0A841RHA8_9SPIO|nr:LacI family DNA-binding transcriptional regulator [Spirochaeta isovalerica]MBB6481682.1 LacI family transcriptional regulator [Spirochaeta isovalerica]
MAVTITDVARLAGVSHTTVSWVIHDDPRITDKTKEKVMKAIAELDYHPNYTARSLVKGKSNNIALVAPFFSSTFEMDVLKGIEDGMDETGYQFSVSMYSTRGEDSKVLNQILRGRRADSVILLTIKPEKTIIDQFSSNGIPLILIEEEAEGSHVVRTNNIEGAYRAVSALIEKGRKRIAIAVETENPGLSQIDRKKGYIKALEEKGIVFDEDLVIPINRFRFEEGQEVFPEILRKKADAVFCAAGDMIAMGMLLEARKTGIPIPQEMAVVGFDDSQMCELVYPSLSTVRQPLNQMGRKAWELAVSLKKDSPLEKIIFEPQFIERDST